jgi:Uma2 family endonuclease
VLVEAGNAGCAVAEQEFDFLGNVYGPDVSFFGPSKIAISDKRKRVQRFVPDLAIEIASPNDTYNNLSRKKDRYLRAGTAEVWLICTETREIVIHNSRGLRALHSGDTLTSELLPGFSVPVDELFAD